MFKNINGEAFGFLKTFILQLQKTENPTLF
jgi:hypothetical protein